MSRLSDVLSAHTTRGLYSGTAAELPVRLHQTAACDLVRLIRSCLQILELLGGGDLCRLGATCKALHQRCMGDAALW